MFYILQMDHNNILGVVLAGGQSKRFGQDKSQVRLQGTVMIDYILSEIIDEFPEILIVSNNDIEFKKEIDELTFIESREIKRFQEEWDL